MGSSRWCPTPEQVMILEEIYKGGIRTPNASQIQHITAHLSRYGKIEGKNVFYWFQNHKARDRQKLRKKQLFLSKQLHHHQYHHQQEQPQRQHDYCDRSLLQSPPTLASHHPLTHSHSHCHSSQVYRLYQGGGVDEDAASIVFMRENTWKMVVPGEKSNKRMDGQDHWMKMMMIDVGPISPPCCNKEPLKTLQLFPTTSAATTTTTD